MKLDNLERNENTVTFEVKEEYSKLETYMDKTYKKKVKKMKLPGFRSGKAPKNIFINHYGKERLMYDSMIELLNDAYPKIVEEQKLDVVSYPKDINVLQMEENQPLKVKLVVEVKPIIQINKYKGIKLEKNSVKIGKEEVQKEIDKLLESQSSYKEDDSLSVENDQLINIDIKATCADEPIIMWTNENMSMPIGEGIINEDFDQELLGLKKGGTKEFTLSFSEDYKNNKEVAGKEVSFKVTVLKLSIKNIPELTDDFVAKNSDQITIEDFKRSTEEKLHADRELAAENKLKTDISEYIINEVNTDIPEPMIKHEIELILRRMKANITRFNIKFEDYLELSNKTKEELINDVRPEAIKNIKYQLAVDYIRKKEEIKATDEEVDSEINDLVAKEKDQETQKSSRKYYNQIRSSIKASIEERKTIDFLQQNAKIKQKK